MVVKKVGRWRDDGFSVSAGSGQDDTSYMTTQTIPTPGDRFTVAQARGGGFIVQDDTTGRNAAFERRDVQLGFAEYDRALVVAQRLNAEAGDPCNHVEERMTQRRAGEGANEFTGRYLGERRDV